MADANTPSGLRTIPAYPALSSIITKRTKGKSPDAYLFHDFEERWASLKRDRSAPIS